MLSRDVTTGKFLVQPLQWLGRICPPGWNRVKVSENLGATPVSQVAPVDTSLDVSLFDNKLHKVFKPSK